MPLKTKNYNLEAFKTGDIYSSRIDRRRFTIIDNEMAFISDRIPSGVILGWDITNNEDGTVVVSPGIGLINRKVVQSFGGFEVSLINNSVYYFSIESKDGVIGGTSGNSNIASVVASNNDPPSSPSGLKKENSILDYLASLSSYDDDFINYLREIMGRRNEEDSLELIPYKEVAFSWSANLEADFSYYSIRRGSLITPSNNPSDIDPSGPPPDPSAVPQYGNFVEINMTTELIYVDINLVQNTFYAYQVVAVDLSGNESSPSEIIISTNIDDRIPSPPIFVQIFPGDETLQVIWNNSPTDNILRYRVVVQPLDADYSIDGDPTIAYVMAETESEFGSTFVVFENLENNKNYDITVYSVSLAGNLSDGITVRAFLSSNAGASEINSIDVDFSISIFENVGLETTVMWRHENNDPYIPPAEKFLITFVENGTRFSEPIEVLEIDSRQSSCPDGDDTQGSCYELFIKYLPYNINGRIEHESIKEYTPYLIMIQAADEDDNISNGVVTRIARTPVTDLVSSVADFSIERKTDDSIFLTWTNSTESYFSHNYITVNILDLGSLDSNGVNYVENLRIDKADTFIIPSSQFNTNFRYTIIINSFDTFGTEGGGIEEFKQFVAEENILRPSSATGLKMDNGDTEIYLQWDKDTKGEDIEFYRIYRATFALYQRSSSFQPIATILSSLTVFTDYTVVNGTGYSYFVTAIDIYGIESLNPVEDGHISSTAVSGTPVASNSISPPEGLLINVGSGAFDVELVWDVTAGVFDGYEILKSIGNNYSFEIIDYVSVSENSYIDVDALLKDGEEYYYIVRKYRNEVILNTTTSSALSDNSISIGKVTTSNGVSNVSIDLSSVINLENMIDPLTTQTVDALAVHHHTNDENIDKRIELRSNVRVSDWQTNDYQVYVTDEDIEGATGYFLQINGTLNEAYFTDSDGNVDVSNLRKAQSGESPVLFEIQEGNNKIVFNEQLYSPESSFTAPYSDAPSVILEMVGISEVDNFLPEVNVGNISASQFSSGKLSSTQIPGINHDGRKRERLLPLLLPMKTLDNFIYSIASTYEDSDRNLIGTSVAFYDIILIEGERLLAATSSGIWLSNDYGNNWEQSATFSTSVYRLYKSIEGEYYAITNYGVYKNNGTSFRTWEIMAGLEFVKAIRDITEDGSGNLYISTDLGVFKLNNEFIPYIEDTWQKMPIFGARSSEAYAIIYDGDYISGSGEPGEGRILVSNELGLVQSVDEGLTWNYIPDLESFIKIRNFIINNNYIFALSDNAVYKEKIGTNGFIKIGDTDTTVNRKIVIFKDKIYITTNDGIKESNSSDIYNDTSIEFIPTMNLMNIKNNTVIVTSLNNISDDIFVGIDRGLYMMDENSKYWLQFEQKETVIPSIYVDGELQKLGFYYNNGGTDQNISFDEIVNTESLIEVSNKYDIYSTEFGGWSHNRYSSKFVIHSNNFIFGESRDEIDLDVNQFADLLLPVYDDNNAHKDGADKYKESLQADLDIITGSSIPSGEDLVDLISDTYQQFELFLSQIYEDSRTIVDAEGNISNFILPPINTDVIVKRNSVSNAGEITQIEEPVYTQINTERGTSYTATLNIVDGVFVFGFPFDKYDQLTVDIFDVTVKNAGDNSHRELENIFEEAYSGPPSYLSQVQQVNLVKIGLFTEKTWPNEQEDLVPLTQSKNIIPVDNNWYDTLNSTINYTKESFNETLVSSINYPSAVNYISNIGKIFVGGKGVVLSIDKDSLEIEEINFGSIGDQLVRSIFQRNDNIFILTDNDIFISSDDGETWNEFNRSGLPNNLYSIGAITNNLIVGAEDGVYIKMSDSDAIDWEKVKDATSPVEIMYTSNILFVVIDKKIHISSNGFTYSDTGIGEDLDIIDIDRHGFKITYVSTIQGLYTDNGTFNSLSPVLEEINLGELLGEDDTVNNTTTDDSNKVVIGTSNGSYGLIKDNILNIKSDTSLDAIHKILIVDDNEWLFGQNMFKVPFLDYPIRLTTGAPM